MTKQYTDFIINGNFHKVDGPAREWSNGDEEWYLNGTPHRVDGPAFKHASKHFSYYIHGGYFRKSNFNNWIKRIRYINDNLKFNNMFNIFEKLE